MVSVTMKAGGSGVSAERRKCQNRSRLPLPRRRYGDGFSSLYEPALRRLRLLRKDTAPPNIVSFNSIRRFLLALFVGLASHASAQEVTVTADHAQGVYSIGQPIRWVIKTIETQAVQQVNYSIKEGGLTQVRAGTIALTNGTGLIEASLQRPGTLLLEITSGKPGATQRSLAGAVVAPAQIKVSAPPPADFDAFWKTKIEELAKVPANPRLEEVASGKPGVNYWKITLDNIRGSHIQGQLARPANGKKLPALLIVQWAGVYGFSKSWVVNPAGDGWLTLEINAHDLPIDQSVEYYKQQTGGALKDYAAIGNDDRDTSYFLRMYLSCYRAAQYLAERPDWNGQTLVVSGTSQGGMQALMTAGLHPKVSAALAMVPAGCDMTGPWAGRKPGWPQWFSYAGGKDTNKVAQASRYYDVVNFATHIGCPVLVGVGLIDETCPPEGVFAAYAQFQGPKEIVILPQSDHHGSHNTQAAYHSREKEWLERLREGKGVANQKRGPL